MKRIKKVFATILAGVLCIGCMTGCGSKEKEVLKVGMEISYPPFESYSEDGSGTPVGIDVDLAYELGNELGMEVTLINTAWDGIFEGLDNGNYDCVISGCTITESRLEDYSFTSPYIQNYQCMVVLKDSDVKPSQLKDIAGLRIGYQEGTVSNDLISEYANDNNMDYGEYGYGKIVEAFSDLEQGRIDVVVCDSSVADCYVADGNSDYEISWMDDSSPEEFGICVSKDNTELLEKLNNALSNIEADGRLEEIINSNLMEE